MPYSTVGGTKDEPEPAVADQGERSVQPLGGDGPHVEAANTRDASAPLTSTPKKRENTSTRNAQFQPYSNGLSSQGIGYGINHISNLEMPGKLVITLAEVVCTT